MKKKVVLLLLISTLALTGCSGEGDSSQAAEQQQQEEVGEQEETGSAEVNEGTGETLTGSKVTYTVESEYDEGSIGYAYDEQQAKLKAVEEQAPEEYADFLFLTESLNSFSVPSVYSLDDSEISDEERATKLASVGAAVAEAKLIKERLDTVEKTANNIKEYEELSSRITKAISYEAYLQ